MSIVDPDDLRGLVRQMEYEGIWDELSEKTEYEDVVAAARAFIDEEGSEVDLYEALAALPDKLLLSR